MRRLDWLNSALCAAVICVARPVAAQDTSPDSSATLSERARALFDEGVALSEDGRWGEAEHKFASSAALEGAPNSLLNLAVTRFHLQRPVAGLAALAEIDTLDVQVTPATQERVRMIRERLLAQLVVLTIHVEPTHAEVRIDGRAVKGTGGRRRLQLDPGQHVLTVSAAGFKTGHREIVFGPGTTQEASFRLTPSEVPQTRTTNTRRARSPELTSDSRWDTMPVDTPRQNEAPSGDSGRSLWQSPWLWLGVGLVVAGTAATVLALTLPEDPAPTGGSEGQVVRFDF